MGVPLAPLVGACARSVLAGAFGWTALTARKAIRDCP